MEPFDNAAASYDRDFTFSETGKRQREVVWNYLDRDSFLQKPKIILEVNCGTGEDALWLAARGHSVIATDSSGGMLDEAKKKQRIKMVIPPQFLRLDMKEEAWRWPDASFDMVFSNFAGLNCFNAPELQRIFDNMHRLLKPGGRLVMILFGKYCLSETFYFLWKGKAGAAMRRWSHKPVHASVEGSDVPVFYYSSGQIASMLPGFRLLKKFAVGLFLPPSYLDGSFKKHPKLAGLSMMMEKSIGKSGLLSAFGDHILLNFEKK
jgi:ubiquinone/menaquinone biosynthesis C-methylase UbiE